MINFNSKFDLKASNIGFFISNDLKFKSDKSVPQSIASKIKSCPSELIPLKAINKVPCLTFLES